MKKNSKKIRTEKVQAAQEVAEQVMDTGKRGFVQDNFYMVDDEIYFENGLPQF